MRLIAPMGEFPGKAAVLEAAKRLLGLMNRITSRARFGGEDQVMLVYDLSYGQQSALCRTAVLMSFEAGLIARIELFYDARPFGNL